MSNKIPVSCDLHLEPAIQTVHPEGKTINFSITGTFNKVGNAEDYDRRRSCYKQLPVDAGVCDIMKTSQEIASEFQEMIKNLGLHIEHDLLIQAIYNSVTKIILVEKE